MTKYQKYSLGWLAIYVAVLGNVILAALSSCNYTSPSQDTQMLQSKYETVYQINQWQYITCDSIHVYHIRVSGDGQIETTIKIK